MIDPPAFKTNKKKDMRAINVPLGHTHSPASILAWTYICFVIFWKVRTDGCTDGQTTHAKIVITTCRDYGSASRINNSDEVWWVEKMGWYPFSIRIKTYNARPSIISYSGYWNEEKKMKESWNNLQNTKQILKVEKTRAQWRIELQV